MISLSKLFCRILSNIAIFMEEQRMLSIDGQILLFIQEHIRNVVCDVFFWWNHASGRCGNLLDCADDSAVML